MPFRTLRDFDFKGKTVLLRADLNVPAKSGKVTDTTRIDRVKPTIDFLREQGAKIVVLSHFGRPKGQANPDMSLSFLPPVLQERWGVDRISFAPDCVGEPARNAAAALREGEILLLENLRFHKGEETNDPAFVKELAASGDIYIDDSFSTAHRAHASTEGLAHLLPAGAGLLMEAELTALERALENPKRPAAAIVGGAKISSKLDVLNNIVRKVDYLILGGGMANTFLYAQGFEIGQSLCEKDMADQARAIEESAAGSGCRIILPKDRIIVETFGENAPHETVATEDMPADRESVDIGPATLAHLADILKDCKTVLWNGPMGVFEVKPFDTGTSGLARIVADLTRTQGLLSVAGGGDTAAALAKAGVLEDFSYVSAAGGAFLEWLEGKPLPGVAVLTEKNGS